MSKESLVVKIDEGSFSKDINMLIDNHLDKVPFINRGFIAPSAIPNNSLLFIGINPSFSKEPEPPEPLREFYSHSQKSGYVYFDKFQLIAEELGCLWSHWDLLLIRETSMNSVRSLGKTVEGKRFIQDSLKISKEILEETKPLSIVVNNTYARDLMWSNESGMSMHYRFKWDDAIGTYRIADEKSNLNGISVFFTGMLTGQRALDKGSYERLKWQLKKVSENENWSQH